MRKGMRSPQQVTRKNTYKIKVSEIFESIQGEGKYVGFPMLFVRLSGCTRKCSWCDSKWNIEGEWMEIKDVVRRIKRSKMDIVCFTGGEPLLQREKIYKVMDIVKGKEWHLETNGDLLNDMNMSFWSHISVSPKDSKVAKKIFGRRFCKSLEIKVVTDLVKVGLSMVKYADSLMPLTTLFQDDNNEIRKRVWKYCVEKNIKYSPRVHQDVWGYGKRGV
jgi:7-carboxy-7-deazaguanine synthase